MTGYALDDQERHLGEPPWSGPEVEQWEAAHGHDCRLPCYPEHGCLIFEAEYYRLKDEVERLRAGIRRHREESSTWWEEDETLWALLGEEDDT